MDTKQFEGMWETRPIRPNRNRTVAGVCAGIGARYRVDPTLVKIAFVVATLFGGSGLVLYIAAWVALPSEDRNNDELGSIRHARSAFRHGGRHPGHRRPQFILLIVLAIIILTSFGPNATWSSGGLLGAALMLIGWWLLYQRTPEPPVGTSANTHRQSTAPGDTGDQLQPWIPRAMMNAPRTATTYSSHHGPVPAAATTLPMTPRPGADPGAGHDVTDASTAPSTAGTVPGTAAAPHPPSAADPTTDDLRRTPPAWDPLGTAQFAWDLPDPAPDRLPAEPDGQRSPLTLIVIGLAVIVGAAGAALHQAGADWFTPARILSMSLAVVGLGLVYAGLRRRQTGRHSSGLVPLALALGVAVVATTAVGHFDGLPAGGAGERVWKPISENDIESEYSLTVGKMVLDLRDVDLTRDRTVALHGGIGEIQVLVGENMNVRADCDSTVGDYVCPAGLDGGRDGTEGPVLTIDATTNIGHVEVAR
ncbi:PspC domain-containing protein [Gordonia sp. OPL2]|uniref:PspC domain-containing protein n=1 Tax=Gordonia sp. OPL2 TaxID=2486274 RepID=UPI00292A3E7B|nr:PspC domain-containing protein [Gordonia sp. OPL2]RPA12281.1 PspC domain-containing protein [Gordonia sp. OPL2]